MCPSLHHASEALMFHLACWTPSTVPTVASLCPAHSRGPLCSLVRLSTAAAMPMGITGDGLSVGVPANQSVFIIVKCLQTNTHAGSDVTSTHRDGAKPLHACGKKAFGVWHSLIESVPPRVQCSTPSPQRSIPTRRGFAAARACSVGTAPVKTSSHK